MGRQSRLVVWNYATLGILGVLWVFVTVWLGLGCRAYSQDGADTPAGSDRGPVLSFEERFSLFYDREPPPDPTRVFWAPLPDRGELRRWSLSFRRWDGEKVLARFVRPKSVGGKKTPILLYLHRRIEGLDAADEVASLVAGLGISVITPEATVIRRRESLVRGRQGEHEKILMDRDAVLDALATLRFGWSREDVDRTRVAVMGASLGANPAVILGALVPEIRGVVSIVGGIPRKSDAFMKLVIPKRKLDQVKELIDLVDPGCLVARIAPRPFLMINARMDKVVSREQAEILFERADDPKQLHWIDGGHRFPIDSVADALIPWFEKVLGGSR